MTKLQGVLTALPAPLNSEGRLVLEVLERHIEDSIGAGVAGFWVSGGTGCSMYLDLPQRKQVLKETVAAVGGRVPVLALVSAMSLRDGITLAEYAGQLGVAGVSALPPIFYKTTVACTIDYLSVLRKASGLPSQPRSSSLSTRGRTLNYCTRPSGGERTSPVSSKAFRD
ncbi:MAG: dihydrodipicolinate synthase family protein [Gemmatimonadetes bacterium]|nr:dihydrodipicolinate synthase family protein [Gemmatimonadota bacterium]